MRRPDAELPIVHMKAGEMYYSDRPSLVVTVLGSCLSVVLYSPRLRTGAICHGMLPECDHRENCSSCGKKKFRYVDCSLRKMIRIFDRLGVTRSELQVKYFGGADLFSRPIKKPGTLSIGRQNILIANKILKSEGLTPVSQDVGGSQGRKLFFYTHTGDVLVKRLRNIDGKNNELLQQAPDVAVREVSA